MQIQKKKICEYKLAHPKSTGLDVAKWATQHFGLDPPLSQSTISRILQQQKKMAKPTF
jgi:hypothetical protein